MTSDSTSVDSPTPRQHPASGEVEYLYDTCRRAHAVVDDEHVNETKALGQTPASTISFRFLDLPAELRYDVYSFVLPTDMNITFDRIDLGNRKYDFAAYCLQPHGRKPLRIGRKPDYGTARARRKDYFTVETQLFQVSKFVSNEAKCKS